MKFMDLNAFSIALGKFKMLNLWQIEFLTYFFPFIEATLGILLLFNIRTSLTGLAATSLLALFTTVIVSKIFEGEEVSCGCFGSLTTDKIDFTTVYRNIIFIAMGVMITSFYRDNKFHSELIAKLKGKIILKNIFNVFLIIIFFFLGVQSLIFALQNKELKNRLLLLTTDRDVLKPGEIAKPITVTSLEEKEFYIDYNNNQITLIFLLSTGCNPCKLNIPNWNELANSLKGRADIRIIGISLDSTSAILEYSKKNQILFPIYSVMKDEFKINYKAFVTPQTYLIDARGSVINTWTGILNQNLIDEIFKKLDITQNKTKKEVYHE
jgi:peroxiredoxin